MCDDKKSWRCGKCKHVFRTDGERILKCPYCEQWYIYNQKKRRYFGQETVIYEAMPVEGFDGL